MIHTTLALLALTLLPTGTIREGEDWLRQAEERLYGWPKPGVVVHFEAQTDVLDPMLLMMKRDLAKQPNADGSRFLDALEHLSIHGTIDTATGKVTTDVNVPYADPDARTRAALGEIKKRLALTVAGCFQGLPLHDPSLLHAGSKVTACDEVDDSVQVTIAGARSGETMRVSVSRTSVLPEMIVTPTFTSRYSFEELSPGHFAPARLDLAPQNGPESHAEYTYQLQGDIQFPATVKISSRNDKGTILFHSLTVDKGAH